MGLALNTLAYAKRLREAGFSEQQAEGSAEALAAAMTDALASKQDLRELESRLDTRFAEIEGRFARIDERFARVDDRFNALERHLDSRLDEQEKRLAIQLHELERRFEHRLGEHSAQFSAQLSDLERRLSSKMLTGMGVSVATVSALVKLL